MFLHPIIQVGNLRRHVVGSLDMTYTGPVQVSSIRKSVQEALDGDLRLFSNDESQPYKRAVINQTESQHTTFEAVTVEDAPQKRLDYLCEKAILEAVSKGDPSKLTATMRSIEPALFDFETSSTADDSART